MMDWTLVTGGGKRLGREICLALAKHGMPVVVHYRTSSEEAADVAEACRSCGVAAESIQGDFSTPELTLHFAEECRKRFPTIKNLINNVGNYLVKSGVQTSPDEWNALFQANVHAPFALCHALLPGIIEAKGNIVNIGVVGATNIHADVKRTAYMATKMALWMVTKSLARELAPVGVRVNMVSPGYLENAVDLPLKMSVGGAVALEDATRALMFLLQDDNGCITGQNIEVGGGIGLVH